MYGCSAGFAGMVPVATYHSINDLLMVDQAVEFRDARYWNQYLDEVLSRLRRAFPYAA